MGDGSKIEWTDATWNPTRGCSRVSRGCGGPGDNGGCYAEAIAAWFSQPAQGGKAAQWGHGFAEMRGGKPRWTGKVELIESMLMLPLTWKTPRRIFVNSTSDLFHEALSDVAIDRVFAVMALAPQHTFQVLTKRPERMRVYCNDVELRERINEIVAFQAHAWGAQSNAIRLGGRWQPPQIGDCGRVELDGYFDGIKIELPLPNVWLGTSVEDQPTADDRIPHLIATPAAVRFVSYEPALAAVDFRKIIQPDDSHFDALAGTHWIPGCGSINSATLRCAKIDLLISGGESGPHARPAPRQWFRSVRDQCAAAGVAYFGKQNGEWIDADEYRHIVDANGFRFERNSCALHDPLTFDEVAIVAGRFQYAHQSDGSTMIRVGKARAGRLLDGIEHNAMPEVRR